MSITPGIRRTSSRRVMTRNRNIMNIGMKQKRSDRVHSLTQDRHVQRECWVAHMPYNLKAKRKSQQVQKFEHGNIPYENPRVKSYCSRQKCCKSFLVHVRGQMFIDLWHSMCIVYPEVTRTLSQVSTRSLPLITSVRTNFTDHSLPETYKAQNRCNGFGNLLTVMLYHIKDLQHVCSVP